MPLSRCRSRMPVILPLMLLVAACSAQQVDRQPSDSGASQRSANGAARAAAASSAVLGDLRTIDPCSLVDPDDLRQFGRVSNAGIVSLDYCLLHVRTDRGSLLQVAVGELRRVDPAAYTRGRPVLRRGGYRIVREPPVPGHCSRSILFSDGVAMRINTDLLSGPARTRMCEISQTATHAALDVIKRGRITHRRFQPNSLAMVDPCTLLDTEVIQQVPGLATAQAQPSPARHQCQWGEESINEPSVRLVHTAGDPPRLLHGAAVEERIAGRRTVVSIVGGDPSVGLCTAETAHIPFGKPGAGQVEVAMLVVSLPAGGGIRACEFARGLAERVWPRLPPAP